MFYLSLTLSHSSSEQDIKELVTRVSTGQGLPWPKPLVFKKIIGEERSRVALLRQLELRLELREQNEMVQSVREEIRPVVSVGNERLIGKSNVFCM